MLTKWKKTPRKFLLAAFNWNDLEWSSNWQRSIGQKCALSEKM